MPYADDCAASPTHWSEVVTFDAITLLDRGKHFELLQDIDSVVENIQHNWDQNGKADSPCSSS